MSSEREKPSNDRTEKAGAVSVLRPHNGLTSKQELFARLWCQGYGPGEAYALAYDNEMSAEECSSAGSTLLKEPKIVKVCTELLKAAKLEEIDNPQKAFRDLMQDIDGARADKNWSAVMAGHDKRLKAWGMLKERHIHQEDVENWSDDRLVKELAGDDPDKQELVKALIGAE